ncbi:alpha/beta hydrolase [Rhodococcoides kyotonense]|uniref:S-formylglutathione hydrolase FrmB n=1 Tax=Rhodococcoides kyotonense TaxID=398843 RepID=A0A239E7B0_9NOCA|nr:alpha/beta hydrolase family protein [Rhodococcus kyotonensis]SNS40546.1 S-formylglutathione hydrolase FrmB [Rhodococcus kyotonensis]
MPYRSVMSSIVTVVVACTLLVSFGTPSAAAPSDRIVTVEVYSPSMDRSIELTVLRAADPNTPAPTLYLLNGAAGGLGGSSWFDRTDMSNFFRDKQVNVVVPTGGEASYYTDWYRDDPVLGRNKWSTFLGRELPPVVDTEFGGNGVNAIAGISMAGTSVLQLAIEHPGLYRGAASYSGCAMTSDPLGRAYVKSVVEMRGRGSTLNMWGPDDDPAWVDHDAYVNAEKLRGTAIYVSSGSGLPGPLDTLSGPDVGGSPSKLVEQLAVGALIESATDRCSRQLQTRLDSLGIAATYNFRDSGTHSWGYWQDDMHDSWPLLASAMGVAQ